MDVRRLILLLGWSFFSSPLLAFSQQVTAKEKTDQEEVTQLREVTVISPRYQEKLDDIPSTVTIITQKKVDELGARDIKDLLRDELGVSVRSAAARFSATAPQTGRSGNESVNIRGLEGNQVMMMVDGIPVPNSFSFGPFATGRGGYVDLDGLKTAEILRGPDSVQYGSNDLGGAVNFLTLNPQDLLKNPQQDFSGFTRLGYSSVDQSWFGAVAVANRSGQWQTMLLGSYRLGHGTINQGDNNSTNVDRTAPNPLDYRQSYSLAKAVYTVNDSNQWQVTAEKVLRIQNSNVYSARAKLPYSGTSVINLDTYDTTQRERASLNYQFNDLNAIGIQKAKIRIYKQEAKVRQLSLEDRYSVVSRRRDSGYQTQLSGISSVLESNFVWHWSQRMTYGVDWSQAVISGVRDGNAPPPGEYFPGKPFPDTAFTQLGSFVQDDIEVNQWRITPAMRFDSYHLSPNPAGYDSKVVDLNGQALTPRLGVVWKYASEFSPYAQWATGFRAPTPDQVNNSFTNPVYGYTSIGNPNLKPERAVSAEVGLRGKINNWRYSAAVFDNHYQDFISMQVVGGNGSPTDPTVFQFVNLSQVHIHGAELRGQWQLSEQWSASAGIAYTQGESVQDGKTEPLDTINPIKTIANIYYQKNDWGFGATVTHSNAKDASLTIPVIVQPGKPSVAQFASPAYTVLDLNTFWRPKKNLVINVGLNNVFDSKYWRWSDVRGLTFDSTVLDAYTAPGRSFNISMKFYF